MEDKIVKKLHKLSMENRRNCSITGVLDVISFDLASVLLETESGMLTIKGEDIKVNRLSVERGEVEVFGVINSVTYSDIKSMKERQESILAKIFK